MLWKNGERRFYHCARNNTFNKVEPTAKRCFSPNHYLNVMEKGMYKIAWCPLCEQGWVVIVKDKQTSQLYAYCTECETEWNDPAKGIKEESCLPFGAFGQFVPPTFEEISKSDWYKYIKESDNEQQTD